MSHPICSLLRAASLAGAALLLPAFATGQGCVYLPDSNPATGVGSTSPFGTSDPNDLTQANQAILFKIPAAQMPAQIVHITAIGFASETTCTRHLGNISVRFGHGANPVLDPLFSANMPGFTNLAMSQENWVWHTPADQWSFIGLDTGFNYNPALGDLVVQVITAGAWSDGPGPYGFHSDPTMPTVLQQAWRFQVGRGVVGTGGPKVRVCWDANDLQVFGGGCQGSTGLTPRLEFAGSSALGAQFTASLRDAAPTAPGAVFLMSVHVRANPLDLTGFGAPTCELHTFLDFNIPMLVSGGSANLPLTVPNDTRFVGAKLFAEWIVLDPPNNVLGVSVSTFGRILLGH